MSNEMSGIDRIREYIENITDWTCLEKLRITKVIIGMLVFDFVSSITLLFPTTIVHFLYVHPAGKAGFVDRSWISYTDVFKFRRYQEWESYEIVDWEKDNRIYINETRQTLDKECSQYENEFSIPGDPGDYLKEVVGHPNDSGYNEELRVMVKLFTAAIAIIYFSCPILLLSLWWKKNNTVIITLYVLVQLFPMFLCIGVCAIAAKRLMCAINIIYNGYHIQAYLITFTVLLWLYDLVKFAFLFLYCIEQNLTRKRKDFGFRKKKVRKNKVGPEDKDVGDDKDNKKADADPDMEQFVKNEKKRLAAKSDTKTLESMESSSSTIKGKKLARELLELGNTTAESTTAEESAVEEQRPRISTKADRNKSLMKMAPPEAKKQIDANL